MRLVETATMSFHEAVDMLLDFLAGVAVVAGEKIPAATMLILHGRSVAVVVLVAAMVRWQLSEAVIVVLEITRGVVVFCSGRLLSCCSSCCCSSAS
jgi:hypothetical protein